MKSSNIHLCNLTRIAGIFLISAASSRDFPKNRLPEIAFAGKSNVGKSSVINRILQRKNFARVGEKPGKTVHVNYFTLDNK